MLSERHKVCRSLRVQERMGWNIKSIMMIWLSLALSLWVCVCYSIIQNAGLVLGGSWHHAALIVNLSLSLLRFCIVPVSVWVCRTGDRGWLAPSCCCHCCPAVQRWAEEQDCSTHTHTNTHTSLYRPCLQTCKHMHTSPCARVLLPKQWPSSLQISFSKSSQILSL